MKEGCMGSTQLIAIFLSAISFVYSQDCLSARLAATDILETVQIYNNEYALEDDHVSYEIASSSPSNSFDQVSDSIRIMVNNQSACPTSCTVTLNRYTDSFQTTGSTVLFFDTEHSFYLPSHYVKDNTTTFVCVANNGSCGATVPIYRYYKISNGGVFHAYSFDQDVVYDGYNQEFLPICYAWSVPTATVASRPTCGTLNFDIPPETLSNLNIYDNYKNGIERDHYYTTLQSTDPSLISYNQTGVIGKVLTSSKSTSCSCLVKLQQQFDNQTGYFHRLDHKLVVTGQEPNRPYEEYVDTGETVYCSKRLGDCGATLPLWKHFQFYDVDTVYTTDSSPLPMSYLYPQTPLCYIWPANYSPNASNIVSGTLAPAPPVTTPQPGSIESTITSMTTVATTATGSTRLSDSGAASNISTVSSSGSTFSTVPVSITGSTSPSAMPTVTGTTFSTSIIISNSSSGTTASTPISSQSTVSNWATSPMSQSTMSTASLPTASTVPNNPISLATTSFTPVSSQSTISVWATNPTSMSTIPVVTTPTTSTISSIYPISMATTASTPVSSQSTISVWGTNPTSQNTMSTATLPTASTISSIYPISMATTPSTPISSQSTVSVWGTGSPSTPITVSTFMTPTAQGSVGVTSPTTAHLSDSGVVTPGLVVPLNSSATATTPEHSVTAVQEVTEVNMETEEPLEDEYNPRTPETFTLSNFLLTTTTSVPAGQIGTTIGNPLPIASTETRSPTFPTIVFSSNETAPTPATSGPTPALGVTQVSPVTANAIPNSNGTIPSIVSGSTESTHALAMSENSTMTTPVPPPMVTGPLVFIIPTIAATTEPPITPSISTSNPTPGATPQPTTVTVGTTHSLDVSPATPTPQHMAQAAPTYSIVGGALDSFTNSPIIAAIISSSATSTSAPAQSQPTQGVLNNIPSTVPVASTTQDPGIIWKAGDWISNTWHSVFGGNDHPVITTSTNQPFGITTTPRPLGGLVGSLINSLGGNSTNSSNPISPLLNTTSNFIDQHLSSNSSQNVLNNTITWIDNKLDNTGEFLSNAWDSLKSSNGTSGSFVNNTQTWIGGAINSTGGFVSNAWDSLKNHNSTTGSIVNNTQTWIEGAFNSTGEFISNAWDSLSTTNHTGSIINKTETWIGGAVNNTGEFLSNAWNSFGAANGTGNHALNETKSWIGGAVNSTGEFFSNAWSSLTASSVSNGTSQSVTSVSATEPNITALASAPHSNPVGSVASVILPIVNASTQEPPIGKVEWNGEIVSGPLTG